MPEKPGYDGSTPLTSVRQEAVIDSIMAGVVPTEAYYQHYADTCNSRETAKVNCSRLLTKANVSARLAYKRVAVAEKADIRVGLLVREWLRLGFSNITDFVQCKDGSYVFTDWDQIDRGTLAAVESIQVTTTTTVTGKDARTAKKTRFKLHSKLNALEQLGKIAGVFLEDNKQKQGKTVVEILAIVGNARRKAIVASEPPVEALNPGEAPLDPIEDDSGAGADIGAM